MTSIPRKSDGRRIFTADFRNQQIARVLRGEVTVAELSRKLGIARSLLQRWKRLAPRDGNHDGSHMVAARERATQANTLGQVQYLRELQLLIGKQALELELLRGEIGALKQELTFLREELNALKKERRSKGAPKRSTAATRRSTHRSPAHRQQES
jgi:transposase-like protein